jgi:hypothetical protein
LPLSIYKLHDVKVFDCLLAGIANRTLYLPLSTPSAMVLQTVPKWA